MISETPETFLRDLGQPVVWGAVSGYGLYEEPDQAVGDFSISTDYAVTVEKSKFAAIDDGNSITVNSVAFTVRGSPEKLDDGVFIKIHLTKT